MIRSLMLSIEERLVVRQYRVTTPEQVEFRYEIGGLVSRAMAWLVDQLILWALRIGCLLALGGAGGYGLAAAIVGIFVFDFAYYVFFELFYAGQSPGKRLFGLRVVPASGARLTFADVMIRNLLRWLDTLPLMMTLGGVVALFDRWHRRFGDLAAETLVIRDVRAGVPEKVLDAPSRENSFQNDPLLRQRILARATREQRDLLFDLMMRRDSLEFTAREQLFADAADYFRCYFALPDDMGHLSDEQTVVNLALVLQAPSAATPVSLPATGGERLRDSIQRTGT